MKVLLCGAAGFTGRAVLEELLAAGHTVRAWDLKPESWVPGIDDESVLTNPRCERVFGSIADFDLVEKHIAGCTAVVHTTILFQGEGNGAPGEFSSDQNHAELPWIVNLKGLWNTLECAHLAGCRRVVHVGSCQHEWPGVPHLKGKEAPGSIMLNGDVRRPDASQYAVHKRLQEEMCRQVSGGKPTICKALGVLVK
jgi:nucleoside-diphosphate-sugar epimerase